MYRVYERENLLIELETLEQAVKYVESANLKNYRIEKK